MRMEVMFLKVMGALMVVSGCSGIGFAMAYGLGMRQKQLLELKKFAMLLKSEIRYTMAPLPEAFRHIEGRLKAPFSTFIASVAKVLETMEGRSFASVWNAQMNLHLKKTNLTTGDLQTLSDFGDHLGFLDREMQLAAVDLYVEQLETAMGQLGKGLNGRQRVAKTLGTLGGLLMAILLF